jgi:aryl-alcohol dehydrogenase-like predicted oxidoreductase
MYSYGSSEEILGRALKDRNDGTTPREQTLEALHDLVKAGKVRYLGAPSMHACEFAKALNLQKQHGWAWFAPALHPGGGGREQGRRRRGRHDRRRA